MPSITVECLGHVGPEGVEPRSGRVTRDHPAPATEQDAIARHAKGGDPPQKLLCPAGEFCVPSQEMQTAIQEARERDANHHVRAMDVEEDVALAERNAGVQVRAVSGRRVSLLEVMGEVVAADGRVGESPSEEVAGMQMIDRRTADEETGRMLYTV